MRAYDAPGPGRQSCYQPLQHTVRRNLCYEIFQNTLSYPNNTRYGSAR
jgi:hypothetical protein